MPLLAGELKAPKILDWVKGLAKGSAGSGGAKAEAQQQHRRQEEATSTHAQRAEEEDKAQGGEKTVPAEIPQVGCRQRSKAAKKGCDGV